MKNFSMSEYISPTLELDEQMRLKCSLNCGLCPMFLNKNCPGCGGGEGNQSCKIARCSIEHDNVQYCFQCSEYPCGKYDHIDNFDYFITSRNRIANMEKARRLGIDAYNAEQTKKAKILEVFLSSYNDGRKKTFFCVAVNLLELQDLQMVLREIEQMKTERFFRRSTSACRSGMFNGKRFLTSSRMSKLTMRTGDDFFRMTWSGGICSSDIRKNSSLS